MNIVNKIGFGTGSGRCGTNFLAKVFHCPSLIAANHERAPLSDTFHRYCKWYGIDVDPCGFIEHRRRFVIEDLKRAQYSFEASPFLALSIPELLDAFDCRIVVLVRDPAKVVSSYLAKDWYSYKELRVNPDLPPSFQQSRYFHHFLGRISPLGKEFGSWNDLSRVGKLAWYWRAINERLLRQVEAYSERARLIRIEDFDFECATDTHRFLKMPGKLDRAHFDRVSATKPNSLRHPHPIEAWSDQEWEEFETQVTPLAGQLNYQIRRPAIGETPVATLMAPKPSISMPTNGLDLSTWQARIRAGLSVALRGEKSPYLKKPIDLELLRRI